MSLVLLAAITSFLVEKPPAMQCRADRVRPLSPAADVAAKPKARPGAVLAPPAAPKLAQMPPAHEMRAVRRMVDGCDFAEIRSPAGWVLKSDQELRTMAGYPKDH